MHIEEIEKFLTKQELTKGQQIKIDFKKRDTLYGLFVKTDDFTELKAKNFWRIITNANIKEYQSSNNTNLAKIFNGMEFSKLSVKNMS